jgi:cytoskeleton protein RodZ
VTVTSIGAYLRELRERRGVPLAEIARTTRVATRYLEALEADAFDALPPPVFTRGFIRAYCQALAESPEEALARYDARDGRPTHAAPRPAATSARAGGTEPRTRGAVIASLVLLIVLGMALFTVALVIQPRARGERAGVQSPPAPTPIPVVPPPESRVSQPLPPVPATAPASPPAPVPPLVRPPATPPPAKPAPTAAQEPVASVPPAAPPAAATVPAAASLEAAAGGVVSPYRLVARTSETTWIRVRTEDGRSSEETVPAGEVREWVSDRPFVLTIGNAAGVTFELNGRTLPPLGGSGAVIPRLVLPPEAR